MCVILENMEQFLETINRIHPLSAGFIQALEEQHDRINPAEGQLYLSSGQVARKCGFILQGAAAAFLNNDVKQVVDLWKPNDFILPGYSLYTGTPSDEGIVLLQNSEIIQLRRSAILMLKEHFLEARIIFNYYDAINEQRAKVRARMLYMKAPERLHDYKRRFPGFGQIIKSEQEASYIGVDPSTRSRLP